MTMLPPQPRRQQQRTERTRARLIDAGFQVFLEQGYELASIGAITQRADLGTGTYYLHFRDKRGLYEAGVRQMVLRLRGQWLAERGARKVGGSAPAELSLMVEMVLESLLSDRKLARLVLLEGPPLDTWLVEEIGREVASVLKKRVAAPEVVAALVIGATLNAARWAIVQERAVSVKKLVATATAFCANGIQ
jgi:AcrR family transcriptional regulator